MRVSVKTICLAGAGAAGLGAVSLGCAGPVSACDITSPTDISCGPANMNPGNPLSPLNPASPFYPTPAAPVDTSSAATPASNWTGGPGASPYPPGTFMLPILLDRLTGGLGAEQPAPRAAPRVIYAPPLHPRHHRYRYRPVE